MATSPATSAPARPVRPLRALRGAGLGLVCALAAWALTELPLTRGVEDWVLDGMFFYRGTRPTDARVVLVGLDEQSLRTLDKPMVYISPELAEVVKMATGRGAAAVGIDLFVPEDRGNKPEFLRRDGPGQGHDMGKVVKQTRRVVLPVVGIDGEPMFPLGQWAMAKRAEDPEDTDFGFVDLDEDGDQFVRRQGLVLGRGPAVPHFALALYARSRGEPLTLDPAGAPLVAGRPVPLDADGRMRVNFVGPPGTFPVVPFRAALEAARGEGALADDRGRPVDLRGATVIVGVTAPSMGDYHATPFANNYARYEARQAPGRMSGPELHGHVFATLHDRAFITTPALLGPVPVLLVCGVLLGIAYARVSLEAGFLLAVAHHFGWKLVAFAAFAGGHWRVEVTAVLLLGALAYAATFALRWRLLRRMFGVVKSETVVQALEADPNRLSPGGENRTVTVLFADIRSFTPFSAAYADDVTRVVKMLNAYFQVVVPAIEAENGTVMSYMGDGIMALFGAPASQPDHAARAARAARAMVQAVHANKANQEGEELDPRKAWAELGGFKIGVGVHTGPVIVGAVGSRRRKDYTVIGDVVNIAARIEGENKPLGSEVLVHHDTWLELTPIERAELGFEGEPVPVRPKGLVEQLVHRLTVESSGGTPSKRMGVLKWLLGRKWLR